MGKQVVYCVLCQTLGMPAGQQEPSSFSTLLQRGQRAITPTLGNLFKMIKL